MWASRKRTLRFELFEPRTMMASDVACLHNIELPEDSDGSGTVTPLDALVVINQVNDASSGTNAASSVMVDVDADNTLSPLDALSVINYLNRQAEGESDTSSNVPITRRISRIEAAINANQLGQRYSLDEAIEILATLRAGGRPELGERLHVGGLIRTRHGAEDSSTDSKRFLDRLVDRLTDAGVSEEIISTIRNEIEEAANADTPLSLTDIKTRLTGLGVDVSTIFPTARDRFMERLTNKLERAEVSAEIITTIVGEIEAAADAGTPLTLDAIKTRLTELGVDVTALFPVRTEHTHVSPLIRALERNGVDAEIIQTISEEIGTAKEAGTPLTREAILARLEELGVDTSSLIFNIPHQGRGRRR